MPNILEKQGYKYTEEFGYIPEDWNICNMDDITKSIASGKSYEFSANGLYNLYGSTGIIGKTNIAKYDGNYILVARVGANAGYSYKIKEKCGISDNTLIIDLKEKHNINFIFYALKYLNINKLIFGSGQPLITGSQLKQLRIQVPPLPEQEKIAEVLEDVDSLIDKTQQLINKKKDSKTATMQKLLTPKEDWEEKKLGDICSYITTGKLDANAMVENGEYRFYTCAKEYYKIDTYAFEGESLLVSGNGANVGYIHYYNGKFNAYQRTYVLQKFSENIFYIKCFMDKFLSDRIASEVNAGNTPYIKLDTITDMLIKYPKNNEQQEKIATILSDMDSEIEALEKELNKYKDIKIGMMQQLLTGKVRLI